MLSFRPLSLIRLSVAVALATGPLAQAQQGGNRTNREDQSPAKGSSRPPPVAVWKAELPGGSFMVARSAINAISSQQYLVDGAARVTEVNISTSGPFQPRFYYLEPLGDEAVSSVPGAAAVADRARTTLETVADQASPEAGAAVWTKVVKNYPETTHAGTIEFRLESLEQLQALLDSVEHAWMSGRSEVFTPEGAKPYRYKAKSGDAQGGADPNAVEGASPAEESN